MKPTGPSSPKTLSTRDRFRQLPTAVARQSRNGLSAPFNRYDNVLFAVFALSYRKCYPARTPLKSATSKKKEIASRALTKARI